jgi:cobalamin biosynthesis protein CobD/CbiB
VISLSGPMMALVMALIVGVTVGEGPRVLRPVTWMEKVTAAVGWMPGAVVALLVPALFGGAALLLGWVNVPELLVVALSVWLLAGCLELPDRPDDPALSSMRAHLAERFVAPIFYYALFGVPGALACRAAAVAARRESSATWLNRVLRFLPDRVTDLVLWVAAAARGVNRSRWAGELAPAEVEEAWRTVKLAAWIAAALAALILYPRHGFLV